MERLSRRTALNLCRIHLNPQVLWYRMADLKQPPSSTAERRILNP
jgi:hypothetical protein